MRDHQGVAVATATGRASLEVHQKLGVGFYCENVSSKIIGDIKIALYYERSVFVPRYGKFFVENTGLDAKYFFSADRGQESITFPLETLRLPFTANG